MTKQPISERRLAANRANAQRSTGPRTPEGKRRVSQNASRHNLYSKFHRLPGEIEDLLYRKALEETADIADPRFRALFVHRLILRGHERRLLQLEGKLWAEALRVNNGIVPYASLWIRENQAEVIQAFGRYHAWICVRIRAIQKSIFPYIIGDTANQTGIPARTQALLASAAGSSRPITLTTQAAAGGLEDAALAAGPVRLGPPLGSAQLLSGARGGFRAVRPVPAPQAVKAIRPPAVPGLSLRFLRQSRNSSKPQSTPAARPTSHSTLREATNPLREASPGPIAVAVPATTRCCPPCRPGPASQSTQPERSKPTQDSPGFRLACSVGMTRPLAEITTGLPRPSS
ncbi:MAG: hypothetical protein J0H49_07830 [Acidobacteria bacterium]|nr:hypothetical protein [Acidobacteriota bacterium]